MRTLLIRLHKLRFPHTSTGLPRISFSLLRTSCLEVSLSKQQSKYVAEDDACGAAAWRQEALLAADDLWDGAVEPGTRAEGRR
jgi:hypothetical protein